MSIPEITRKPESAVDPQAKGSRASARRRYDHRPPNTAPPFWLRNPHLQTCWGPLVRKRIMPMPSYRRERIVTPDGDALYLYFNDAAPDAPWVLLLHGLEGSVRSFYVTAYNHLFHNAGWNMVTLEYRTCSGEINQAPRTYHMGECEDLAFTVDTLNTQLGAPSLCLIGVSLGANILAKWLGESADKVPGNIRAASVVSPPFDPRITGPDFHKVFFGIYSRRFLRTLIPKSLEKARQYPELLDAEVIPECWDFTSFDTHVTARLHGFEDAMDYWTQVGCTQFLPQIRVPTLLIAAEDDPFNRGVPLPHEIVDASPWLHARFPKHGGHAAFVARGGLFKPRYWAEEEVLRFFADHVRD